MGMRALVAAFKFTVGDVGRKAILLAIADHACDNCGLAWPGVRVLCEKTEHGERSVQVGLKRLVDDGLLEVFRFPHGGRGLSTEYVVLPHLWDGAVRPCPRCASTMKNPAAPRGVSAPQNPAGSAGVSRETPQPGAKKGAATAPPTLSNPQPSGARTRARGSVESGLPAGPALDHPSDDPTTREAAAESMRAVAAMTGAATTPTAATATAAEGKASKPEAGGSP